MNCFFVSRLSLAFVLAGVSIGLCQPAPEVDTDSDGIVDFQDPCPLTPRGAAMVIRGCSALDLAENPAILTAPLGVQLVDAAKRMTTRAELSGVARELEAAIPLLDVAADEIRGGGVCNGSATLADTRRRVQSAQGYVRREIDSAFQRMRDSRVGRAPAGEADFDQTEADLVFLEVRLSDLERWDQQFAAVSSSFADVCRRITGSSIARGKITKFDDRLRRVELDTGLVVGLSAVFAARTPIWVGRTVEFYGSKFSDGSGMANSGIATETAAEFPANIPSVACLHLRFAPVQARFPGYSGPWTKHRIEGYDYGQTYWLENGMGIAVESAGCPTSTGVQYSYKRYSAEATLTYTRKSNNLTVTENIATDLTPGSAPVFLNQQVKPFTTATLTVKTRVQQCFFLNNCSAPSYLTTTSYKLSILPLHSRCVASYDKVEFNLEDDDTVSFRPAQVVSKFILAAADSGQSVNFSALAYKVTGPNSTTAPYSDSIGLNQSFGIYNKDFYNPGTFYAEEALGVSKASGLKWPKITSVRNNHTFSFSCQIPDLVRDAIHFGSPLNTYYRLPFSGGTFGNPVWTMGQGNNGSFTHNGNQAYAFDFIAATNTTIKAARGGTVVFVREDQTGNSYSNPNCSNCKANAIIIRHQDGTEAAYFHMPQNGVWKSQYEHVYRGDSIAKVGNTGYSTTAHLHFQAQNTSGVTHPSCFEAGLPFTNQIMKCYVPNNGAYLESTQ